VLFGDFRRLLGATPTPHASLDQAIQRSSKRRPAVSTLLAATILSASSGAALAASDESRPDTSTAALVKKLEAMEKRVKSLESELKQKQTPATASANGRAPISGKPTTGYAQATAADTAALPTKNKDLFGVAESPVSGLKIGMYGEIKFGSMRNPAANGQWQNGFDMGRLVLLPSYQVTENIIFNAEIEFEHSGTGFDKDDKLHGTAEIEQAFFDFKINDYFNIRSPGVDIVPISFNNLYHEPTLFYSVQRPELANGLIPTTWVAPSTGFYGKIVDGLTYQFQLSQSLEDFGDDFGTRTDANTVPPFPGGYAPGVDGLNALGFAKAPLGDFRQLNNTLAYTGRLAYSPAFLPGFAGSSAVYYSPNITPRGAYADDGTALGKNSVLIFDTEARYRIPNTGFELRGEFAHVTFGNPANLRANNDDITSQNADDNVGKTMFGYSGEIAYHFKMGTILGSEWEAVPFYRYTYQNLQTGGFAGIDSGATFGAGQQTFHDFGVAVFPNPSLVLKLNYTKTLDKSATGPQSDSVLGGVGWLW
jgi:Phosphate-selective porin O and P